MVATDLGTTQRTRIKAGHLKQTRLEKARRLAARIEILPIQRPHKAQMAGALLLQGALYGTEIDPLTEQQHVKLRGYIAQAVWGAQPGRNRHIQLLLHRQGRLEPKAQMELRMLCAWGRLLQRGPAPDEWQQRWEALPEGPGYRADQQAQRCPPPARMGGCAGALAHRARRGARCGRRAGLETPGRARAGAATVEEARRAPPSA